jgi:hypothetical protein
MLKINRWSSEEIQIEENTDQVLTYLLSQKQQICSDDRRPCPKTMEPRGSPTREASGSPTPQMTATLGVSTPEAAPRSTPGATPGGGSKAESAAVTRVASCKCAVSVFLLAALALIPAWFWWVSVPSLDSMIAIPSNDDLPSYHVTPSSVVIMVMVGSSPTPSHIALPTLHRQWVASGVPATSIVFFVERAADWAIHPHMTVVSAPCGHPALVGMCCKLSYAYMWVQRNRPTVQWVVRVTDDTFLHWANLLAYLQHFDSTQPRFLGERVERGSQIFADSGAGWVVSRASLDVFVPRRREFMAESPEPCNEPAVFSAWLEKQGTPLQSGSGFHNENAHISRCASAPCGDGTTMGLSAHYAFHAKHTALTSRPITFHLRYVTTGSGTSIGGCSTSIPIHFNSFGECVWFGLGVIQLCLPCFCLFLSSSVSMPWFAALPRP